MRKLLGAVGLVIGVAGQAFAADMPVKARPVPAVASSWTGFYAGITGGYGWGDPKIQLGGGDNLAGIDWFRPVGALPTNSYSLNSKGGMIGAQFGYDYQFNPTWVVGVVTDISYSGIRDSQSIQTTITGIPTILQAESKLEWFGTLRGKLGWLPMNNVMLYGSGGLAYGKVTNSFGQFNPDGDFTRGIFADGSFINCAAATQCLTGTNSRTSAGWSAGAGTEIKLSQNINLSAEYLYVSLDSPTVHMHTVPPSTGTGAPTAVFSAANYHMARAALTYHFHQ